MPTYRINLDEYLDQYNITCLECGMTSYNKHDVINLYCGRCHKFHKEQAHAAKS